MLVGIKKSFKIMQKQWLITHKLYTRSSHSKVDFSEATCFLFDKLAGSAFLHECSTYDIDMRVQRCAMELEDTALMAKLLSGDMIALEAEYSRKCITKL